MTFAEKILHTITDPNIAYLLMSVGILGVTIELYSPGLLFPGVTGIIALLLAFISLGSLPISWAGLVLIGVALIMFVLELLVQGFGMLGIGGIIAFILGSLFLYRPIGPVSPALPQVQVSPWLIATTATALGLIVFAVMRAVIRSQRGAARSGPESLVGTKGVTESVLEPAGFVRVDSEQWSACIDPRSDESHLDKGDIVEVTEVRGVTLFVRRADAGLSHQSPST
jgi:membrane-bound serine protease (ClpP class)